MTKSQKRHQVRSITKLCIKYSMTTRGHEPTADKYFSVLYIDQYITVEDISQSLRVSEFVIVLRDAAAPAGRGSRLFIHECS